MGLGLREPEGKLFEVKLGLDTAVAAHRPREARQVGAHLGHNLDLVGELAAEGHNGAAQRVGGLFAALDARLNEMVLKLQTSQPAFA